MRVTNMGSSAMLAMALSQSASRVQDSQADIATGKKLRNVSDSPTDTATVLRYNAHSAALGTYKTSAQDAQSWLASSDTALQSISTGIMSAMTTLQSAGSPAMDATAVEALASQLDGIAEHLYSLGNTRSQDRAIFGGFAENALARDADGAVVYAGDGGVVSRQVSASQTVTVNSSAADIFGFSAGDDIFSMITEATTALRAGDKDAAVAVHARLGEAHTRALSALERVGSTGVVVETALTAGEAERLTLTEARSNLVDVDIAAATLEAQLSQLGYQAALAAAARADMPSLADYLR